MNPELDIEVRADADLHGLDKAKVAVKDVGEAASTGFDKLKGQAAALAAQYIGLSAIVSQVRASIDLADNLQDSAEQLGVSARNLQVLGNVASTSGSSLGGLGGALNFLLKSSQAAAREADGPLAAAFQRLGLSVEEIKNLSPDEIFLRLADAVATSSDRNATYADILQVMGKGAGELFATLSQGRSQIEAAGNAFGAFASDEEIARLANAKDAIARLSNQITVYAGERAADALLIAESAKEYGLFESSLLRLQGVISNISGGKVNPDLLRMFEGGAHGFAEGAAGANQQLRETPALIDEATKKRQDEVALARATVEQQIALNLAIAGGDQAAQRKIEWQRTYNDVLAKTEDALLAAMAANSAMAIQVAKDKSAAEKQAIEDVKKAENEAAEARKKSLRDDIDVLRSAGTARLAELRASGAMESTMQQERMANLDSIRQREMELAEMDGDHLKELQLQEQQRKTEQADLTRMKKEEAKAAQEQLAAEVEIANQQRSRKHTRGSVTSAFHDAPIDAAKSGLDAWANLQKMPSPGGQAATAGLAAGVPALPQAPTAAPASAEAVAQAPSEPAADASPQAKQSPQGQGATAAVQEAAKATGLIKLLLDALLRLLNSFKLLEGIPGQIDGAAASIKSQMGEIRSRLAALESGR